MLTLCFARGHIKRPSAVEHSRVRDAAALANAIEAVLRTPCERLPDVRQRARDFEQDRAIDAYLAALGLPPRAA